MNEEITSGKNLVQPAFSKSGVNEEKTSGKNIDDPGLSKSGVNEERNITESVSDFYILVYIIVQNSFFY